MSRPRIKITPDRVADLEFAAKKAHPFEACALLVGDIRGEAYAVSTLHFSENISKGDRQRTFEVDPELQIKLQKSLRDEAMSVIGVWHSHPSSTAELSEEDMKQSLEGNYLWLISGGEGYRDLNGYISNKSDPHSFEEAILDIVGSL